MGRNSTVEHRPVRLVSALVCGTLFVLAGCQSAQPAALAPTTAAQVAATQSGNPAVATQPASATQPVNPAAASQSPEVARLIAAAQAAGETEVDVSWSTDIIGGPTGATRMADLMNRMYGLNVKVSFTPGPSMTNLVGKVVQEVAAGQTASTDILVGSELHYSNLVQDTTLEPYDYTQLSPRITPQFVAPNNIGVEYASRFPAIAYNTNLIAPADAPRTLADTLNPKWKGQVASTVNAAEFDRVATMPNWGIPKTETFIRQLSQQISGLVRCGSEEDRVSSGEFSMLVLDCGTYTVRKQAAQGAPLAGVIPEDAPMMAFWYLGVPRTSAHSNLAKLYINAIMSQEGQRLLYAVDFTDHADLPGSQSAPELADLRARGIEPLRADIGFVLAHPEIKPLTDDYVAILRQGSGS